MPELPEVETVRRGLQILAPVGTRIDRIELMRPDLRFPIPESLPRRIAGQAITGYRRWGKYLLWDTAAGSMLSHLGMSGTWREAMAGDERIHDHVYLHLGTGRRLVFHDPRRFGFLDLVLPGRELDNPRLKVLGPDALDGAAFHSDHLASAFARRRAPVKSLLLDQGIVAGVGNIYACEALYRCGIRPRTAAGRIAKKRVPLVVDAIREVLLEAIESGGSTLRDFRQAGGETGYFQHRFAVYGRDGEPCHRCGQRLVGATVAGRATVWCPRCQK